MVVWGLILTLAMAAPVPAPESLSQAKKALELGHILEAIADTRDISPFTPAYRDKLLLFTRFSLAQNNGLETWRLIQLGHRLRRDIPSSKDYERLSLFLAGACPLAIESQDPVKGALLNAAVYRFQLNSFTGRSSSADLAHGDEAYTHLAVGLVPYLNEIPNTTLLAGRGCRLARNFVRNKKSVFKSELSALSDYLDFKNQDPKVRLFVLLRALELAGKNQIGDKKAEAKLKLQLPSLNEISWSDFPDPEKRFLFLKIFIGQTRAEIAPALRDTAQRLAIECLMAKDASPEWLAEIDPATLSARERITLFSRAEKIGRFKGRGWVLLQLAEAHHQVGESVEALTILRRLLAETEEALDDNAADEAAELTARIFSENQLNEHLIGALQAALPPSLWLELLNQAKMRAALMGQAHEYAVLEKMSTRLHGLQETSARWTLAKTMAERNFHKFKATLNGFKRYGMTQLFDFTQKLASFVVADPQLYDKASVGPYLKGLAGHLRELSYPGGPNATQIDDLYQLVNQDSGDWNRGQKDVREGVERLGVAKWTRAPVVPAEFRLNEPDHLPLRELYYVPDFTAAGEGWKFLSNMR